MKKTICAAALISLALTGCNPVALLTAAAGKAAGASTGSAALKFSAVAGSNANAGDFGGSSALFTGQANGASPAVTTLAATTVDILAGGKARVVTVTLTGAKPSAGANFPVIGTAATPTGSAVTYTEPAVGPNDKIKIWISTGGAVTVDSVAGQTVSVMLKGCTMSSAPAGSGAQNADNVGTGTFTLDGSLKVDGIKGL
jgi:hypothetical protein